MAIIGGLYYFEIIDVLRISEHFLDCIKILGFIIPIVVLLVLWFILFSFIKKNLYLDRGLEMKKAGKTENIAFLNKYGTLGTFINNDIRLIKRSKAARSALIGGVLFLFTGYFSLAKVTIPVLCKFSRDFCNRRF